MSKPKLTAKQARLVKGVVAGKSKRQAAIDAGYSGSPETVSVTASEVLRKPNVQDALNVAFEKAGITPELAVAPIGEALRSDDLDMRLKGSDRALKFMAPKQEGTTINQFGNIVNDMKAKYDE